MSAEEAQMAKALKDIAYHQKTLVAIFTTLNTNLVGLAKIVERVLSDLNEDENACPRCKNLHCEVLGCNPKIKPLSCGCAPSYCNCGNNQEGRIY